MLRMFRNHRYEIGILTLFSSFLIIQLLFLTTGIAWVYLDPDLFSFWMLVSVAMLAIVSGIVATYSFVQYTQEGTIRSFIIMLLGANVILLAFLYLITHPATTWSVFSDRQRNLTIDAALGFLVIPGVLGSSLVGHRALTRRSRNIALLWGFGVQPFMSLVLLLSPEPVFTLTSTGFGHLSIAGWVISIIFGASAVLSLVRYLREWTRKHEHIILASSLALVLWMLSFLIVLAIDSPIQVAELLWFGGAACGFVLLAATMIVTAIIEPHRALESLVKKRTVQLVESREETEFYLRLWTHKIGNLLQGISTYLELIGYEAEAVQSLAGFQKPAMDLVKESTTVNRQVERLVRIKEKESSVTWPVNLGHVLSEIEKEARENHYGEPFFVQLPSIDHELQVVADDLIDIVFANLLTKCAKHNKENPKKPSVRIEEFRDSVQVFLGPCSSRSFSEMQSWSVNRPPLKNSVVDLDLFMVWLLMQRYGGKIEHLHNVSIP
ncbi:MAG: hypothetical protein ACFFCP_18130, partial [Promethearchaeota archaeon]